MTRDMLKKPRPILWSFRRCPYAMRARMAVLSAGLELELREIKLKEKPQAFLAASPSATVPNLQAGDLSLDESLDIMFWALGQNDPHGLLNMPDIGKTLIAQNDGPFKAALDHTKYAVRYPDLDPQSERRKASDFIQLLNTRLTENSFLTGDRPTLADIAIFPFVRQFAHIDRSWFDAQPWPYVILWLDGFLQSAEFQTAMTKIPTWEEDAPPYLFGQASQ
ncbi:glutathione S-transferase [Tropicibacter sp. R16_0]|uniref:glutathione S-transferase n=1 Tax=Tropicibacter sp. R16_0 TaxID=2821102 RepID=UPI001ADAF801|nr:glutathione S-transferase [Tropicibacter sp. R16_0]MBO9448894.1 glutathione S-transferase [Tropicibacter sp. R16_0]